MISMLRLINPPGHRPRKGWKMPRYAGRNPLPMRRRASGEYAVSALRTAAAKKRARAAASLRRRWLETRGASENPRPRRRSVTRRTTMLKRDRHGRFLKRTTVKRTVVSNPRRATRRQGVKAMPRKRVTHRRRLRHNPVAANPRRRRARRNPITYIKAGKRARIIKVKSKAGMARVRALQAKGLDLKHAVLRAASEARARAKRKAGTRAAPKRRTRRTKTVYVTVPRKRRTSRRRVFHARAHKGRVMTTFSGRYMPSSRRRTKHAVRRTTGRIKDRAGRSHRFYRYNVSRNPGTNMKNMLIDGAALYGGFVGAKIVAGLLDQYVFNSVKLATTMAPLGRAKGILAPAISFVLAAFAGKLIPQPKVVASLQTGATLAFFQAAVKALIPPTALVGLPPAVAGALMGIDDMGFRGYGYGMGEYIQQRPQLGAYVQEAMALDEYVQDPGGMHGYDVQEALADSEVQGMQSGFAAGSLAKTVFSNF